MQSRSRAGFTLIELMVSMALTMVVMTILAQAFVLSLDTFSGLKGLGDMQRNFRTAAEVIKTDLGCDHFDGSRGVSDLNATNINAIPEVGFFSVRHFSKASTVANSDYLVEGLDQNGMPLSRAVNHVLHFTVKRRGNRQQDFFTTVLQDNAAGAPALNTFFSPNSQTAYNLTPAQVSAFTLTPPYTGGPKGFFSSQWAEVLYYLVPTGALTDADPSVGGVRTFSLYRAQFVMLAEDANLTGKIPNTYDPTTNADKTFQGVACNPGPNNFLTFLTPQLAGKGARTISSMTDKRLAPGSIAATLVLPNVISFQVQIMPTTMGNFIDVPPDQSGNNLVYDTSSFASPGYLNTFGLKAVQVTLRVWDPTTRQTRQTTIIQDL